MEITLTAPETGLLNRMSVIFQAQDLDQKINKKLQETAKTLRIDGFRKGKVPPSIVKQRYGKSIANEIMMELAWNAFYDAAQTKALKLASQPMFEVLDKGDDNTIRFTAAFEVYPEFELVDFASLTINPIQAQVTEGDVQAMIDRLREQSKVFKTQDKAAAMKDNVIVDFVGKIDGVAFDRGSAEKLALVLGSGRMIPGFEEGILGMKAGEQKTISVTFPVDYQSAELKGKEAQFDITLHEVQEAQLPEVDSEFVKKFGVESGNVEDFHKDIREHMERELEAAVNSENKNRTLNALKSAMQFDVPTSMLQEESQRLLEETKKHYASQGMAGSLDFLKVELFKDQAKERIQLGLILAKIASDKQITASDDEVNAHIEKQAAAYEDPQEVTDWYKANPDKFQDLKAVVSERKVIEAVMAAAQGTPEQKTFEEVLPSQK